MVYPMLTLQILSIVLLVAFGAFFWIQTRQEPPPPQPNEGFTLALDVLDERMRRLELRWQVVQEELEDRLERGTHAFRKARQAEAYRRRKEELGELVEEEPEESEDMASDVREFDAFGGDERGMQYVRPDMGDSVEAPWQALARSFAQHVAGRIPE